MKTAIATRLPDPGAEPDALIREARKRQRRRYLTAALCVAVLAGTVGAIASAGLGSRLRPPSRVVGPTAPAVATFPRAVTPPNPMLAGSDTSVVMWPVGYPLFTPDSGPPARVYNLSTGRLTQHQIPRINGCDCNPYVISTNRWLVYVSGGGVAAIRPDLTGWQHVLGRTEFFAPSAQPGRIWLVHFHHYLGQPPVRVQSFPIAGGSKGPVITLPAHAVNLVQGTDAGLLLEFEHRLAHGDLFFGLELWNPGSAPVALPDSPAWGDGFAADARLIAYGTGCGWANARGTGYDACKMMRVLNVDTGRLLSFAAPQGTAGWLPFGFNRVSAISPGDEMIAAYAEVTPRLKSRFPAKAPKPGETQHASDRLYVLRLAMPAVRAIAVPEAAPVLARTAWSVLGSWLLYQGPGGRLWAYQLASGKTRASNMPCCQSEVMVTGLSH